MNTAFEIAELKRRMDNLIRVGTIIEANYEAEPPVVRIKDGEHNSGWIPFMTDRAHDQEVSFDAPEIGERVMVLAVSGNLSNARVLPGSLYCEDHLAPAVNPDVITRMHKDGAHDTYEREAHVRTIQLPQEGELKILIGGSSVSISNDAISITSPAITLDGDTITLAGETHLGGAGGEPVARKGDDISHATEKITKGSDNVFSN